LWAAVVLIGVLGCQPAAYRSDADRAANRIIDASQAKALGKREPIAIESPADTLRRRLLVGQELPISGSASLGVPDLPKIPHWPEDDYPRGRRSAGTPAPGPPVDPGKPVTLTLVDALQVAAANNRDYTTAKETVFLLALALDLERHEFQTQFAGFFDAVFSSDQGASVDITGVENTASLSLVRRFKRGGSIAGQLLIDLVKLLSMGQSAALGITADATITLPLLLGAGEHVVTEPLTQAQRNVIYALYDLERFKQTLAVSVARDYLAVLSQLDQLKNAEENYRSLVVSGRRARKLADAGRLPEIQVDQAEQDALRARDQVVSARQTYMELRDLFKIRLGLPADARIALDPSELEKLSARARAVIEDTAPPDPSEAPFPGEKPGLSGLPAVPPDQRAAPRPGSGAFEPPFLAVLPSAGPPPPAGRTLGRMLPAPAGSRGPTTVEPRPSDAAPTAADTPRPFSISPDMDPAAAIGVALENRLDLRILQGRVVDAQRKVTVAANALEAGLTLEAGASIGERRSLGTADLGDAELRFDRGRYTAGLLLDLPLERTAERNAYRESFVALERSVRNVQAFEDDVKLDIMSALRSLQRARDSYIIQYQSVNLARKRVRSTELFLDAGRAQIRDLLEAQEALVLAQNALTAAVVSYRVAELELQRDMGILTIDDKGLWSEPFDGSSP
jgi:outer membrane protein TolC